MKQIKLTITAKSPLAIGRKKPGSVSEAADFIAGSVIRGAIAGYILRLSNNNGQPEPGDDFHRLFVDNNAAVFCNCYPAVVCDEGKKRPILADRVSVLPATAVSAKNAGGFKPKGNGAFDTLIDRFCANSLDHIYDPSCPKDGDRLEPFSGFYSQGNYGYTKHSIDKRLLTRVGINRRRATSEEKIMYSLEVLNESQGKEKIASQYRGSIFLDDDALANQLTQFINANGDRFRLGGGISRGLGRVKIEAKNVNFQSQTKPRIQKFNELLKRRWEMWNNLYNGNGTKLNQTHFTLDLRSDGIFTDRWRRTTVITPEMLCRLSGVEDDSLTLHAAYSSYDHVSGWNSAWGLMKDIDLMTTKGSVYLFGTEQIDRWYDVLERMETQGIGDRTSEGFGQVEICHEFHNIFRENAV
jgi:CRISPR-associated protein Csx10